MCDGLGYTEYEFEPHYIQDGWQIKNKDDIKKEIENKIKDIESNHDYYGLFSSELIEKEKQKLESINKIYPIIKREED